MGTRNTGAATVDSAAITLSGLCLIHCLALPMLTASLPVAGAWIEAEWVHQAFVVAALPFALIALRGQHIAWHVALLIGAGLALLIAGAFVEALHDYETLLTVVGAIALACGHTLRWLQGHSSDHS